MNEFLPFKPHSVERFLTRSVSSSEAILIHSKAIVFSGPLTALADTTCLWKAKTL